MTALGLAASRLGASTTLAIVISSQLLAALLLDRLSGRVELGLQSLTGVGLLLAGALLVTASGRSPG